MNLLVLLGALMAVVIITATTIQDTTVRGMWYWVCLPPLIIGCIAIWWSR